MPGAECTCGLLCATFFLVGALRDTNRRQWHFSLHLCSRGPLRAPITRPHLGGGLETGLQGLRQDPGPQER